MADLVVSEGYADVGYEYINVDDCWLEKTRGLRGELVADRKRFPRGMKSLGQYVRKFFFLFKFFKDVLSIKIMVICFYFQVHSRGLKFGIYQDFGNYTCAGYPGIVGYARQDAQLFADWEVDYVKLDGCYSLPLDMDIGYPDFGRHLNNTGRAMIYSCSWPVYQIYAGIAVSIVHHFFVILSKFAIKHQFHCFFFRFKQPNFSSIIEHCNLWRNFDDIQDSWQSLESIIDYYGNNQDSIIPNAGPGHW